MFDIVVSNKVFITINLICGITFYIGSVHFSVRIKRKLISYLFNCRKQPEDKPKDCFNFVKKFTLLLV